MSENADITSIEPYVAVVVNDTLDETRTDLPALIQRMENQIALQNQVIRQFLQHWDSISHICRIGIGVSRAEVGITTAANQPVILLVESSLGKNLLTVDATERRLSFYNLTNGDAMHFSAD